ncbi:HAD family hydrolase [Ectobacillus sp. JY-23]|uniref:HAD family hydrolase n=1 Tax=Ectobacillus sp. JY-23 TaxID=2933872 RepID=UPI001FF1CC81|nr:HAD family hydrolase [Ectobacillus sp. JY-23]UOY92521.1 HAD family hydrolase [Ectobacillus sp. JY-23]
MIKAVLFDLDGTLLDRDASLRLFIKDQYRRYAHALHHIPEKAFKERFIHLDQRGYVWKDKVYKELIREYKIEGVTWEELLADYVSKFQHSCTPFPNLALLLRLLQEKRMQLGIITNGFTNFQTANLRALGLHQYIDAIFISEQEGLKKPNPALFQRALCYLNVKPEESLYVGDHPDNDVRGARQAGMHAVWKRDPFWGEAFIGDDVVDDLLEIIAVIERYKSGTCRNK